MLCDVVLLDCRYGCFHVLVTVFMDLPGFLRNMAMFGNLVVLVFRSSSVTLNFSGAETTGV